MAGFWHLSHHQMRDPNGGVYAGARASFLKSDSLLPLTVYQDYGLGTPHPNPVVANSYGIFPPVFLDETDSFYRQRITTSGGVIIPGTDVGILPIIGPSGGEGGAEVPVDTNALLQTGDFLWQPRSGARSGFVRANGRTIGPATSGASERANADCEALYLYLHQNYSNTFCPVTGGRGASAAADWGDGKPLGMPNARNKGAFGLPDMGNSDSGEFDSLVFGAGDKTTPLSFGGDANLTILTANLPPYTPSGSVSTSVVTANPSASGSVLWFSGAGVLGAPAGSTISVANLNPLSATSAFTGAAQGGSSTAMDKMPPFMLGTWYVKL